MIEHFYIVTTQSPAGNLTTYTGLVNTPENTTPHDTYQAIAKLHYGLTGAIVYYHVTENNHA